MGGPAQVSGGRSSGRRAAPERRGSAAAVAARAARRLARARRARSRFVDFCCFMPDLLFTVALCVFW